MLTDPMLWALLLVALLPKRARAAVARHLATASTGAIVAVALGVPLVLGGATGAALGFFGLTIAAAVLLLPCFAVVGRTNRGWIQAVAIATTASLWTLQLASVVPYVHWGPNDATPFWFVDLFNRFFDPWLAPLVVGIGGQEALDTALRVLASPLAALSHNLLGFHALIGGLVITLLYGAIRPYAPRLAPIPPPTQWRLPRPVLAGFAVAWGVCEFAPDPGPTWIVHELTAVVLVARGALLTWTLTPANRTGRLGWTGLMTLTLLVPETAWALGGLAAVDSLWLIPWPGASARTAVLAEFGRGLRRWLLPATLVGAIVPAAVMVWTSPPEPGLRLPKASGPLKPSEVTEATTRFALSSGAELTIDRYEYPTEAGTLPLTGKRPAEAAALCEARGKRLCPEALWKEACSGSGRNPYMLSARTFPKAGAGKWRLREALIDRCDLGSGVMHAAGSLPRCVSAAGAVDIVGNAYEWVALETPGMWGLVGGYHGVRDLTLSSCDFAVRVHDAQLEQLDLSVVGFRCCGL